MHCPKCGYERKPSDKAPDWQCPGCGIAFAKYKLLSTEGTPIATEPQERADAERETLVHRLLAALVAIPVFELSLYLALGQFSGQWSQYAFLTKVPLWIHGLYVGAASIVGLILGFKGITWLLGHLFLTHFENERDPRITGALWAAFGVLVAIGYFVSAR